MLTQIHIRDLATIEELHLQFHTGNTMITGETGAGKSIFIEAIELGLGGRASQNIVRGGKEKAEISLCFDITRFPHVIERLEELEFFQDSLECIIRRIITNDGRSRCYVNSIPATATLVKELGELLFHLHGQHEQQVLLKNETQRDMLDRFADHLPLANKVKNLSVEWQETDAQIKQLQLQMQNRQERIDYLRFQLEELQSVNLQPGEWEKLEADHHKLMHAEKIIKNIHHVLQLVSDSNETAILTLLNEVRKDLEGISTLECKAKNWLDTTQSAAIQLQDFESELQNYLEDLEMDPDNLKIIEERLSQIFSLSRKHKIAPPALFDFQEKLLQELNSLNAYDDELQKLTVQLTEIAKEYTKVAGQLSTSRQTSAKKLEKEITTTMRSLSLPHGEFKIELEAIPKESFKAQGHEKITYLIKTNPDQLLQPLTKVISGGELSRLSLALHLALASRTTIPTLVFDEVDTGLSGATAEKIGKLLRKLGDSYQVFCITHQPQVAACGHHHLLVEKYFIEKSTYTRLRLLNQEEKAREIARMLGGEKITAKTLEHAKEVLASV